MENEKAGLKDYEFDAVTWEAQRFDAVERKFQEELEQLKGDANAAALAGEYEKLLRVVRISHGKPLSIRQTHPMHTAACLLIATCTPALAAC